MVCPHAQAPHHTTQWGHGGRSPRNTRRWRQNGQFRTTFTWRDNDENSESIKDLFKKTRIPHFKDSPTNRLQAIIMLMNVCNIFGVPNACADELLKLLKYDLLPKENTCPSLHYEAKKLVRKLGFSYNTIHAWKNDHYIFKNELKDAKKYPQCKGSRYVPSSDSIPVKVLRHSPLMPRLQMFGQAYDVACGGKNNHNKVRSIVDSKA